eukprot:g8698.t1
MSDDATTRDAGVVKTQLISSRGEVKVDASGDKKYSAGSSAHSSTRNISVNDGVQNNVGNTSKTAAMDTKASRHGEPNDSQNRKVTEPQNINMQSSRGHLDIRDGNNAATSVAAHGIPQGQQPSAEVEADAPRQVSDAKVVVQDAEMTMQQYFSGLFDRNRKFELDSFKRAKEIFPQIFEQTTDTYGRSALHLAILKKNLGLIQWLVEEGGARENAVDHENQSIAHYAAYVGDEQILTYLIDEAHCSINMKDRTGRSLLSHAAMRNNWQIIDLLVSKYEMNVDSKDHFGSNALHWAAAKGATQAGLCLVQKGINIHLKVLDQSPKQILEMHKAADDDSNVFFRFLDLYERIGNDFLSLASKKSTQVQDLGQKMAEWENFAKMLTNINNLMKGTLKIQYYRNRFGQTALHLAAQKSNFDVVKFLVNNNFYITAQDYLKRLPVHYAALYGRKDIALYLINMPASEDEKQIRCGKLADDGDVQVVKHWLKKTKTGLTPDAMAAEGYEIKLHGDSKLQEILHQCSKFRNHSQNQQQQNENHSTIHENGTVMGPVSDILKEEDIHKDQGRTRTTSQNNSDAEYLVGKGASIVLDKCKLPQYVAKFNEDGFDTIESLKNLNESDLKDMGVKKGHIRVIMKYLHESYVS